MKVCTCILLFRIFVQSYTYAQESSSEDESAINRALETVLEFGSEENISEPTFLNNVRRFMYRIDTARDKNKRTRRVFTEEGTSTFTYFIQQAVAVLNTYDDKKFKEFFDILDSEIRKYHYRGCKFHELTENYKTRMLFASKLDLIRGKSVFVIKTHINELVNMIRDENYDNNVKEFVDYINSLYREDAEEKFKEILINLENHSKLKSKRNKNNLVKIIRDGVRAIIFDHYTNLNKNVRRDLKNKIESFWKPTKETHTTIANIKFIPLKVSMTYNKNKTRNAKEPKSITTRNLMNIVYKEEERKRENYDKISDEHSYDITLENAKQDEIENKKRKPKVYVSAGSFEKKPIEISQKRQRENNAQPYKTLTVESQDTNYRFRQKNRYKSSHELLTNSNSKRRPMYDTNIDNRYASDDDRKRHKDRETKYIKKESQQKRKEKPNKHSKLKEVDKKHKNVHIYSENDFVINVIRFNEMDETERTPGLIRHFQVNADPSDLKFKIQTRHPMRKKTTAQAKPVLSLRSPPKKLRKREKRTKQPTPKTTPPTSSSKEISKKKSKRQRRYKGNSLRRSLCNDSDSLNFGTAESIVIKRIDDLEKKLDEVKEKIKHNNDDNAQTKNKTDEYKKKAALREAHVKLVDAFEDLNNDEDTNSNDFKTNVTAEINTNSTNSTINNITFEFTESINTTTTIPTSESSNLTNVEKMSTNKIDIDKNNQTHGNATEISNKENETSFDDTKVTTKEVDKEIMNNNVVPTKEVGKEIMNETSSITNTTNYPSVVTSTSITMPDYDTSYTPYFENFDTFDNINQGFDSDIL